MNKPHYSSGNVNYSNVNFIYVYNNVITNCNLFVIFLNAASPVITEPKKEKEKEKNETRVLKVPAELKRDLTYYLKYYSWTQATTVSMQKKLNNTKTDIIPIEVIYSEVDVSLPVFSQSVITKGNQAVISLYINTEDDFGIYDIVVSNVAGIDVLTIEVVPEGMYSLYQNVISHSVPGCNAFPLTRLFTTTAGQCNRETTYCSFQRFNTVFF